MSSIDDAADRILCDLDMELDDLDPGEAVALLDLVLDALRLRRDSIEEDLK